MPNWVTNKIKILNVNKENAEKIKERYTYKDNFDFEKVIPMPENIFRGDLGDEERKIYGENNWYDWSIKNWETKWNAVYSTLSYAETNRIMYIEFDTAWSCPKPVLNKFAEQLYNDYGIENIEVQYADEDIGNNCGEINYDCGEPEFISQEGNIRFALEVKDYSEDEIEEYLEEYNKD